MISYTEILIKLGLAALLGGIVGIERERKDWNAGLRTHMMVCVGSTLIMIVSIFGFHDVIAKDGYSLDPSRLASQVISGIGFIGAGTILFLRREIIRGLTTASGLWTVSAIGLAVGGGLYFAAISATIIAIIILWLLKPLSEKLNKRYGHQILKIICKKSSFPTQKLSQYFHSKEIEISSMHVENTKHDQIISISYKTHEKNHFNAELLDWVSEFPDLKEVTIDSEEQLN